MVPMPMIIHKGSPAARQNATPTITTVTSLKTRAYWNFNFPRVIYSKITATESYGAIPISAAI